jgi:uncharacterized membrane protein YfcA
MLTLLLALCAFVTATLSGVFGMAGGLLLMGVYAALLPVASAMVLHGATQLFSNGLRAALLWRSIYFRALGPYVLGMLGASAVLFRLRYVPEPAIVFLGLGLVPFVPALLPARYFAFERPATAPLAGALVGSVQLLAGAAGPLLDVAFANTKLERTQVVATKAFAQVLAHVLKLAYFAPLASQGESSPALLAALLVATALGTRTGTRILERMSESSFRRGSRGLLYAIGACYLLKGGLALAAR